MAPTKSLLAALSLLIAAAFLAPRASAAEPLRCTVVLDARSGETLHRQGACGERFYPQSTFKLPLAIMGYDAGILVDAKTPRWNYQEKFKAPQRARKSFDPTGWEAESIVWYSQEVARKLGKQAFDGYVRDFGYGNGDTSGNPGKGDGLTQSWLMSSLKISVDDQVRFLRAFVTGALPVSDSARRRTMEIIPRFTAADGWQVQGKTGAGWLRDKAGKSDANRPLGWFVGWASKGDRQVVFARVLVDVKPHRNQPISFTVRDSLIADLPLLIKP